MHYATKHQHHLGTKTETFEAEVPAEPNEKIKDEKMASMVPISWHNLSEDFVLYAAGTIESTLSLL